MQTITRSDIYARVHKGLRKALFDLAYLAGRTDYACDTELARLKTQARESFHFLEGHGGLEDTYQLPVLEANAPGTTQHDNDEHERIHEEVHGLGEALDRIGTLPTPSERYDAGEEYYLRVNTFISDYLTHMHHEETVMAPLYFEHCPQEDLLGMVGAIVANSTPANMMMMLRYTIPALNHQERARFLRKIRNGAPAPAFNAAMHMIGGTLNESEWTTLRTALNNPG